MCISLISPLIPRINQRRRLNSRALILAIARTCLDRPTLRSFNQLIPISPLRDAFFDRSSHAGSIVFLLCLGLSVSLRSERMYPFRVRPGRAREEGHNRDHLAIMESAYGRVEGHAESNYLNHENDESNEQKQSCISLLSLPPFRKTGLVPLESLRTGGSTLMRSICEGESSVIMLFKPQQSKLSWIVRIAFSFFCVYKSCHLSLRPHRRADGGRMYVKARVATIVSYMSWKPITAIRGTVRW